MLSPKGHVLFIAYDYPPSTQAEAKRAEGFHRFLPDWGYRSTLITIEPGTGDETRERNVVRVQPSGYRRGLAKITPRTSSAPVRFLTRLYKEMADIPDGYRSFFAPARAAGLEVAKRDPVNAVVATSSPYTSLRIGSALSQQLRVPWIADLRDLWTANHYGYPYSPIRLLVDSWLEKRWLKTAGRVVTATKGFSRQLANAGFPNSTIYNGFLEQPAYQPPLGVWAAEIHRFRKSVTLELAMPTSFRPYLPEQGHCCFHVRFRTGCPRGTLHTSSAIRSTLWLRARVCDNILTDER